MHSEYKVLEGNKFQESVDTLTAGALQSLSFPSSSSPLNNLTWMDFAAAEKRL